MTIDFRALGKGELTSYGYREALRLDEEEAREINDVVTRCARAGLRVRVVVDGMNRLVVERRSVGAAMTEERLNEFERFVLRPGESTLSHGDVIDELIAEVRTLHAERREWIRYTDDAKKACGRFNDMTGKPLPETCAEMLAEIDRLRFDVKRLEEYSDHARTCPAFESIGGAEDPCTCGYRSLLQGLFTR